MNAPANQMPLTPARAGYDDEIDLFELIATVWQGRWICLALIAIAVALATIYITQTPKIYTADTTIYPVNDIQLALIAPGFSEHKENHNIGELSSEFLYDTALNQLQSAGTVEKFLSQSGQTQTVSQFLGALTISRDEARTKVSFNSRQPQEAAAVLKSYLAFVSRLAMASATSDLLAAIDANTQYLDRSIAQARQRAEKQIDDKAIVLTEAIDIAKALDVKESRLDRLSDSEVGSFNDKLYLSGTRALEAELAALLKRRQNDAFVPELRQLEAAKGALIIDAEKIHQNMSNIDAFTVPTSLLAPAAPTSPKTTLIILAAIMVGALAGLFIVFLRHGVRAYRDRAGYKKDQIQPGPMPGYKRDHIRPNPMAGYKKAILKREGNNAMA